VIATKFFMNLFAGDPNGGGARRKAMVTECEESLGRLQTDYIDLYYIHMAGMGDIVNALGTRGCFNRGL